MVNVPVKLKYGRIDTKIINSIKNYLEWVELSRLPVGSILNPALSPIII